MTRLEKARAFLAFVNRKKSVFLFSLLLVATVQGVLTLMSPLARADSIVTVLKAIIDVSGVLLGLSGIMFANTFLLTGQVIWEYKLKTAISLPPPEALVKYRKSQSQSLVSVYGLLVLAILTSLALLTRIDTQLPNAWLPTFDLTFLPVY